MNFTIKTMCTLQNFRFDTLCDYFDFSIAVVDKTDISLAVCVYFDDFGISVYYNVGTRACQNCAKHTHEPFSYVIRKQIKVALVPCVCLCAPVISFLFDF